MKLSEKILEVLEIYKELILDYMGLYCCDGCMYERIWDNEPTILRTLFVWKKPKKYGLYCLYGVKEWYSCDCCNEFLTDKWFKKDKAFINDANKSGIVLEKRRYLNTYQDEVFESKCDKCWGSNERKIWIPEIRDIC